MHCDSNTPAKPYFKKYITLSSNDFYLKGNTSVGNDLSAADTDKIEYDDTVHSIARYNSNTIIVRNRAQIQSTVADKRLCIFDRVMCF